MVLLFEKINYFSIDMKYHVKISGKALPGKTLDEIKPFFARAFSLTPAQLEQALSGRPKILARNADEAKAFSLLAKLKSLGLEASLEKVELLPPVESVPIAPAVEQGGGPEELFSLQAPLVDQESMQTTPAPLSEQVVCPKCGEVQGKRTLCQACGLDMPRYLAAQNEAKISVASPAEAPERSELRSTPDMSEFAPVASQASPLLGIRFDARLGRLDYLTSLPLSFVLGGSGLWFVISSGQWAWGVLGWFLTVWFSSRASVLRLHDMGKSGWWVLLGFIPLLGFFLALFMLFGPGDADENEWGGVPDNLGVAGFFVSIAILFAMTFSFGKVIFENPQGVLVTMGKRPGVSNVPRPTTVIAPPVNQGNTPNSAPFDRFNRVELYVTDDCGNRCESLRTWLWRQDINFNEFHPDHNTSDADRLAILLGKEGLNGAELPVAVINGKLHHQNVSISLLEQSLRRVSPAQ